MFKMRCHCQATVQHIQCHKWLNAGEEDKNRLKSCGGPCPKQVSLLFKRVLIILDDYTPSFIRMVSDLMGF